MKLIGSHFFFFFFTSAFYAQDSLKVVKRIRINDIGAHINLFTESQNYTDQTDFKAIAPQSSLLKNDLSRYTPQSNGGMFSNVSSNTILSVFAGFKFSNKERTEHRKHICLKAGLTLFNQQVTGYYNYTRTMPYNVLTSSATGNMVTLDSVINKSYDMTYSSQQLRLDISFLWNTDQQKHRISFYTGLGISTGISVKSTTSINYGSYSQSRMTGQDEQFTNYAKGESVYVSEEFKNKKDYGLSVYIPLGADLVLGRKYRFWRNTHVYYEVKPSYNILVVLGVRDYVSLGIQHGWGLRFTI